MIAFGANALLDNAQPLDQPVELENEALYVRGKKNDGDVLCRNEAEAIHELAERDKQVIANQIPPALALILSLVARDGEACFIQELFLQEGIEDPKVRNATVVLLPVRAAEGAETNWTRTQRTRMSGDTVDVPKVWRKGLRPSGILIETPPSVGVCRDLDIGVGELGNPGHVRRGNDLVRIGAPCCDETVESMDRARSCCDMTVSKMSGFEFSWYSR